MTSSSLQHIDNLPGFPFKQYDIPLVAKENNVQGLEAHEQMLSSMLTVPPSWPGSADYNHQISTLFQQPAVRRALQAIIEKRMLCNFSTYSHQCLHLFC